MASDELIALRKEATELGIEFAPQTGIKTLQKKISEAKREGTTVEGIGSGNEPVMVDSKDAIEEPFKGEDIIPLDEELEVEDTEEEPEDMFDEGDNFDPFEEGLKDNDIATYKKHLKPKTKLEVKEAMTLMRRVTVVDMSPVDSNVESAFYSVGNDYIGQLRRLVKFGKPWFVPQAILDELEGKELSLSREKKIDGKTVSERYTIPRYSIKYLPELSLADFKKLERVQALENGVENEV